MTFGRQNKTKYLCVSAGPDSSSHSPNVRPSVPATRSMPQRAAAAESAQTAQTKAALKQVCTNLLYVYAAFPLIFTCIAGHTVHF